MDLENKALDYDLTLKRKRIMITSLRQRKNCSAGMESRI